MAGVALIIGALAANVILGQDRGGMGPTLVVATVVALMSTATGLAVRHILTHPVDSSPADRRVDRSVETKTAWSGHTTT